MGKIPRNTKKYVCNIGKYVPNTKKYCMKNMEHGNLLMEHPKSDIFRHQQNPIATMKNNHHNIL
jgi:hypothetical protein